MKHTKMRSLVKALSYRVLSIITTIGIAFLVTKQKEVAFAIGSIDASFKLGLYYLHERFWHS